MSNEKLSKAQIKAQRVKKVFIDTTKQMIIEDGIDNVSTRKIADTAGYAFATLYNHFKDLDELLIMTRDDIIGDITQKLVEQTSSLEGKDVIRHTFKYYIDYCVEYPNAFKFFFLYTQKSQKENFDDISSFEQLGQIFMKAFANMGAQHKIPMETLSKISNTIFYSVHGMLIVHLSNNFGLDAKELYKGLDDTIDILLKNYISEV